MNPLDEFKIIDSRKNNPFPPGKATQLYRPKPCCSTMLKITSIARIPGAYPMPCIEIFGQIALYCPYCGRLYEWEEL